MQRQHQESFTQPLSPHQLGPWSWYGRIVGFMALCAGLMLLAPTACTVGGTTCQQNRDCPTTGSCQQGSCVGCTSDSQCSAPQQCKVGRCISAGTTTDAADKDHNTSADQSGEHPAPPDIASNDTITAPDVTPTETQTEQGPQEGQPDDGRCKPGVTRHCYSGNPTELGVGACKAGAQACNENGEWGACLGEVTATPEQCGDGIDNDCDGLVDEPDAGCQCKPGEQKPCGSDVGTCQQGTITCNTKGEWGACLGEVKQTPEICDGLDNDCDGEIDEDWPNLGKNCAQGEGACRTTGKQICRKDGVGLECDSQPGQPAQETCNNIDDNCDGQIDEALQRECYSGPTTTKNIGECRAGTQICTAGQWGTCKGEVTPTTDICDGKDNDCDGKIDQTCPCTGGQSRKCGTNIGECKEGSQTCSANGNWGACTGETKPSSEVCDGLDNNCDGQIDETFASKGKSCSTGIGACKKSGVFICSTDGTKVTCNAKAGTPTAETCNQIDDDCDGQIDENVTRSCYTGPTGTDGQGLCKKGTQSCNNGIWGACSGEVKPTTEVCDGLDNDCDGQIDETFTNKGQSCSAGLGVCKKTGTYVCKADGSGTSCNAVAGKATAEKCDGLDNDCDGSIDEDFTNKGKACTSGKGACARTGTYVCATDGSGTTCNATPGTPTTETCNKIDDNCDGLVDNNNWGPCVQAGCPGIRTCNNGVLSCFVDDPTCCVKGRICP